MPNWFYIDQSGQKQGPINDQLLQSLAAHGAITPQTPLETDTGRKGLAGQIKSLKFVAPAAPSNPFTAAMPPPSLSGTSPPQTANQNVDKSRKGVNWGGWIAVIIVVFLMRGCVILTQDTTDNYDRYDYGARYEEPPYYPPASR